MTFNGSLPGIVYGPPQDKIAYGQETRLVLSTGWGKRGEKDFRPGWQHPRIDEIVGKDLAKRERTVLESPS